jgi:hypothetical protein
MALYFVVKVDSDVSLQKLEIMEEVNRCLNKLKCGNKLIFRKGRYHLGRKQAKGGGLENLTS